MPESRFPTTSWNLVVGAGSDCPGTALEELCARYWRPVYAFIRRRGYEAAQAEDLTQAFFTALIERRSLQRAWPPKIRFRSFLLASVRHFLSNERDRRFADKRGGRFRFLSLDDGIDHQRGDAADPATPETVFERKWADVLFERALAEVEAECATARKAERYQALKEYLTSATEHVPYAQLAAQSGCTEAAIKMSVHRLRDRFAEALRAAVRQTVADPSEVDDELRYLLRVLTR